MVFKSVQNDPTIEPIAIATTSAMTANDSDDDNIAIALAVR
jgi:hypothetical protein